MKKGTIESSAYRFTHVYKSLEDEVPKFGFCRKATPAERRPLAEKVPDTQVGHFQLLHQISFTTKCQQCQPVESCQ